MPRPAARDETAVIEDATFLADTGTSLTEAAARLGFPTDEALAKWLRLHGQRALANRLQAHNPAAVA